jgi:NADH-quinone oxidoreductase subunit L
MTFILRYLWLIPALPLFAAALSALLKQRFRLPSAALAIGSMSASFLLSLAALTHVLTQRAHALPTLEVVNFTWFQFGDQTLQLGWILNPLTAVMLVMVTFVGLLIFIYSAGYMAHDDNFTRFFTFLALFAGAMLGVILSNSLLSLFMCWEIVGLTSYLLIGFWFHKPEAAAAAKKAFLVTRIGDLPFFLGIMWLYSATGTLLFYNHGAGALETTALSHLLYHVGPFVASTAIALLIFSGAAGKSGQLPLHVWLPDAMEGPTPVSALIHAATMVAAGVFLVARCYPLMAEGHVALNVVTWIGALTAVFGALSAVAQFDIKRILAYSTVSQLGYMMMGLGTGGVSVGIFHLLTHAFFKALLFLGAGSVIHGCDGEQDIRSLGGLRKLMPITFLTYTIGMLALSGFPLFFSGFWSKDEILHAAHLWPTSQIPFYLGVFGALLTAFYMTRQLYYVFAGASRLPVPKPVSAPVQISHDLRHPERSEGPLYLSSDMPIQPPSEHHNHAPHPHESPAIMTIPLMLLAACAVLLGFLGTPVWPWLESFLEDTPATINLAALTTNGFLPLLLTSTLVVFAGLFLGYFLYGRKPILAAGSAAATPDPLAEAQPALFKTLTAAFYFDALYAHTIVPLTFLLARSSAFLDLWIFNGLVQLISYTALGLAHLDTFFDRTAINGGFDLGTETVASSGRLLALLQTGHIQLYLKFIGAAAIVLIALLLWGGAH